MNVIREGIPQAGIPRLDICTFNELLWRAGDVIDYVRTEAHRRSIDLSQEHERGSYGRELQHTLELTARKLHIDESVWGIGYQEGSPLCRGHYKRMQELLGNTPFGAHMAERLAA